MLNPYVIRKYSAMLIMGFSGVLPFFIALMVSNLVFGVVFLFLGLAVGILISNRLLKNAFTLMLEGKGILAIDINSTGVMRTFIVKAEDGLLSGNINKKNIEDVFDREALHNISEPVEGGESNIEQRKLDGKVIKEYVMRIGERAFHEGKFRLNHFPVFLWNSNINSVITKDFLSEQEKTTFAEHAILYQNRLTQELTSVVRDFARHVVELQKPKESVLGNKWFWIILLVGIFILLLLFGKPILQAITGVTGTVGNSINSAGAVIPK